ncbi:GGDEF domain-containing protein [Parahaliea mediterranea]|uniref:diguanylate cyclase n=1 Tax=Parahaliea mediterranea TaxID=651086 RepID=A0A939DD75_9GAMM|nr:diguanylate cyclase [Parahaliea mediterranea]MBN7796073.1 diguanylate cyclase [Parahaliea mediterranea]
MIKRMLRTRSMRSWVAFSLLLALAPLAVFAALTFQLLDRGVIASYADVSYRMRHQIAPVQLLRLHIQGSVVPVDEYLEDRNPQHANAYRMLRAEIEGEFANLLEALGDDSQIAGLARRSLDDWTEADQAANTLLHTAHPHGDPRLVELLLQYHGRVESAIDKLAAVYRKLDSIVESDYGVASLFYERSLWVLAIAAFVSLLTIIFSVRLISEMLSGSVDRLVEGALKFADGERDHRIEVDVPPELGRVANEFNIMIDRVRASESKLAELARRDPLTGLPNRREFDEALTEMRSRLDRFGERWSILAIDIDHFKAVNDTYGHAAGDQVLKAAATTMQRVLRPYDRLFRTGGEEFTALLPDTGRAGAGEVAERLRSAIERAEIHYRETAIPVTISLGVAVGNREHDDGSLVEAADTALYEAKAGGRNRYVVSGD